MILKTHTDRQRLKSRQGRNRIYVQIETWRCRERKTSVDLQRTKLYTAFMDAGVQHFESEVLTPTTNEQLLRQLEEQCAGVEFTVRDASKGGSKPQAIVDELEAHRDEDHGYDKDDT